MTLYVLPIGPFVVVQETPFTPATLHVPVPAGEGPVDGPETVAVKVNVDPRATVLELVVTITVGMSLVRVTVVTALVEGPV